jgi:glucosamine--fructose-6-phosphate aminotransferase (isomerizing)
VHNGVVKNYESIRKPLLGQGFTFGSETDTEVLANLIEYHFNTDMDSSDKFLQSVRKALFDVWGTYGLVVLCKSSPLLIGIGHGEMVMASGASAITQHTRNVVYMNDGEIVRLTLSDCCITTLRNESVDVVKHELDWQIEDTDRGGSEHYVLKEIFEQPCDLENAMRRRFYDDLSTEKVGGLGMTTRDLKRVDRTMFCACGTV